MAEFINDEGVDIESPVPMVLAETSSGIHSPLGTEYKRRYMPGMPIELEMMIADDIALELSEPNTSPFINHGMLQTPEAEDIDRLRSWIGNKFSEYEERISDLERIVAQPSGSVRFADIFPPENPVNDAINRRD